MLEKSWSKIVVLKNEFLTFQAKAKGTAWSNTSLATPPLRPATFSTAGLWRHRGFLTWPTPSTATGWTRPTPPSSRFTRRRFTSTTCLPTTGTWASSDGSFQYSSRRHIVRYAYDFCCPKYVFSVCLIWQTLFLSFFFNAMASFAQIQSSIQSKDLNHRPLFFKSSPLTTRSWLLAIFLIYYFKTVS